MRKGTWWTLMGAVLVLAGCSSPSSNFFKPSSSGGFFENDGPPVSARSTQAKEPIPKIEPFKPVTLRPYTVMGKTYTPMKGDLPYKKRGIASWYGRQFHNKKTATGEVYDMHEFTAAHPTLPLPSYARVTNLDNGKQIIVRVNDRGPFLHHRLIDLSYEAAKTLGYEKKGTAHVEVERLTFAQIKKIKAQASAQAILLKEDLVVPEPPKAKATSETTVTYALKQEAPSLKDVEPSVEPSVNTPSQAPLAASQAPLIVSNETIPESSTNPVPEDQWQTSPRAPLEQPTALPPKNTKPDVEVVAPKVVPASQKHYTVQLGFFGSVERAKNFASHSEAVLASNGLNLQTTLEHNPKGVRVLLNIHETESEARELTPKINQYLGINAFLYRWK